MTLLEYVVFIENQIRKYNRFFPPELISFIYSDARKYIIKSFTKSKIRQRNVCSKSTIRLWDINFNCGLFNAAGMFKDGRGYEVCAKMGAGAFLSGTTTLSPRVGNSKNGIKHPFMPYTHSYSASNWMGLPNKGHALVAKELSKIEKVSGCPVGASISSNPDASSLDSTGVIEGLTMYEAAGVNFIELNESCPNVISNNTNKLEHINNIKTQENNITFNLPNELVLRLEYISQNFLARRKKNLPVILKLSNDTSPNIIPDILDLLITLGFDGINFGNTSTNYKLYSSQIHEKDKRAFNYFTKTFGGGLSGEILKSSSLELCTKAKIYIESKKLQKEFHCIRTGGVSNKEDILASKNNGIVLNEWFSGFFENFAKYGFDVYEQLVY